MPSGQFADPKSLIDKEFNDLTVIEYLGTKIDKYHKSALWKCKCKCGNYTEVTTSYLKSNNTKSCGCRKNKPAINYNGYKELSGMYWNCIQKSAAKRGHAFDLKIEDVYNLFIKQSGYCALSGVEIKLERNYRKKRENQTASLDRIDSTKGYTLDNIQWVHKIIQLMKNGLSEAQFFDFCNRVTANYKSQKR